MRKNAVRYGLWAALASWWIFLIFAAPVVAQDIGKVVAVVNQMFGGYPVAVVKPTAGQSLGFSGTAWVATTSSGGGLTASQPLAGLGTGASPLTLGGLMSYGPSGTVAQSTGTGVQWGTVASIVSGVTVTTSAPLSGNGTPGSPIQMALAPAHAFLGGATSGGSSTSSFRLLAASDLGTTLTPTFGSITISTNTSIDTPAIVTNQNQSALTGSVYAMGQLQATFLDSGTNSATTAVGLQIAPTIDYTGATKTGSYTALEINATEMSLPSGANYLINAQAGVSGTTSEFSVSNTGTTTSGLAQIGTQFSTFAAFQNSSSTQYGIAQDTGGGTYLNAASGQPLYFRIANANVGQFTAAGIFTVSNGVIGMPTLATDVATTPFVHQAQNADPTAVTNLTGSNLILGGGLGVRSCTVSNFTTAVGSTVTVTVNGSATVFTAVASGASGAQWNSNTSTTVSAANLAAAIVAAISATKCGATSSSNVVYLVPVNGVCYSLSIASANGSGTATTVANGTDGLVQVPISNLNISDSTASGNVYFSEVASQLNIGISRGGVTAGVSCGTLTVNTAGGITAIQLNTGGKTIVYNQVSTAGMGLPAIYGAANVTAQSGANASIATYTSGAADGDFEVSGQVNVTAVTAASFSMNVTYTDVSNTSRVAILPVTGLTGSFIAGGLITATGAYETVVLHIRAKASTAITISTSAGTYTGVTYSASGVIKQVQ